MDIVQIVTVAVALLAPYLTKSGEGAAKKAGEKALEKVEALYEAIRRKFAADKDDSAEKTLQDMEEQPTSEGCHATLANILAEKAQTDPEFAQELSRLVQSATQDKTGNQILTQVYGGQVDKIINIGRSDIVNIN